MTASSPFPCHSTAPKRTQNPSPFPHLHCPARAAGRRKRTTGCWITSASMASGGRAPATRWGACRMPAATATARSGAPWCACMHADEEAVGLSRGNGVPGVGLIACPRPAPRRPSMSEDPRPPSNSSPINDHTRRLRDSRVRGRWKADEVARLKEAVEDFMQAHKVCVNGWGGRGAGLSGREGRALSVSPACRGRASAIPGSPARAPSPSSARMRTQPARTRAPHGRVGTRLTPSRRGWRGAVRGARSWTVGARWTAWTGTPSPRGWVRAPATSAAPSGTARCRPPWSPAASGGRGTTAASSGRCTARAQSGSGSPTGRTSCRAASRNRWAKSGFAWTVRGGCARRVCVEGVRGGCLGVI